MFSIRLISQLYEEYHSNGWYINNFLYVFFLRFLKHFSKKAETCSNNINIVVTDGFHFIITQRN
jgi:hypothetical protein